MICGQDQRPHIMLVNSPLRDYDNYQKVNHFTLPTLGLGYIATCAEQAGFNVAVLDAEVSGLGVKEIATLINEVEPEWVGLNLLAPTYRQSVAILQNISKSIRVMLGGHQAKAMPEHILADNNIPRIDALIIGEAEMRVPIILESYSNRENLPGVYWRENGEAKKSFPLKYEPSLISPDINKLPFVDRKFLQDDPYFDGDILEAAMVGSRGCPFDCSFCGAAVSANPDVTIRMRHPENLIKEITELKKDHNISRVRFVDDLFLANRKSMFNTLNSFVLENLQIHWDATGRINVLANADDSLLELMLKSGCKEVALGIETGSDRLLKHIDKKITVEQIEYIVPHLCNIGINVKGYFILGLPTETNEEHMSTIKLIESLWESTLGLEGVFRCSVFEYRPYPGTPDWIRLRNKGYDEREMLDYGYEDQISYSNTKLMHTRDEFDHSTGIQFGEVPVELVRKNLFDIMQKQLNYAK